MNNEIATQSPTFNTIGRDGMNGIVSTIDNTTMTGKKLLFKATQDAQPLEDHLNTPFSLANVVMQSVQLTDSETGETRQGVRTILIDDAGNAFSTSSDAVRNAIVNLFGIFGVPSTWEEPIEVRVERVKGRTGRYYYKLIPTI